jgi:Ca2+-transporting ATPase
VRETKDIQSELSEENFEIFLEGTFFNTGGDVSFDDGEPRVLGTPTEAAILSFGLGVGGNFKESCERAKLLKMEPFNSKRKVMGVVVKEKESGKIRAHWKGASEIVLERCDKYVNEDGKVVDMDDNKMKELKDCIHTFADGALRTLCLAFKDVDSEPKCDEPIPDDGFVLLAVVGIKDPVRPGVKEAVELCFKAGIKVTD